MTHITKSFRLFVGALAPAVFLAGCGPIIDLTGGGEPPALYELRALDSPPSGMKARNWVLFVEEPSAPGALRTDQIAVRISERGLEYLAGARWSDRTPHLLGRYFEESVENTGLATVIGSSSVEIVGDYRLRVDIRDFSADVGRGRGMTVTVRISALLVRGAPADIVGRKQFAATVDARGRQADLIVAAFNEALDEVTRALLTWLSEMPGGSGS